MKTLILAALLISVCLLPAGWSQSVSKEAKIDQLLTLTKADALMNQMMAQMRQVAMAQVPSGVEEKARYQEALTKVFDLVQQRLDWQKLKPDFIKLYSDTFSDSEIDGLLAFYQSPAGHAMLEKMPGLLSKSTTIAQARLGDLVPEMQRILSEAAHAPDAAHAPKDKP